MQNNKLQMLSSTVTKLLHRDAYGPLEKILSKLHPADLGYFFRELTNVDRKKLFEHCGNSERKAEVLSELDMIYQVELISLLNEQEVVQILNFMDNDDVADLLEELDDEKRERLLELMKDEDQEAVEELMTYDPSTAGGIMNPSFLWFTPEISAKEAIVKLQESSEDYAITFYIYILNSAEKLIGVVSLRQLVTCKPNTELKDLMTPDVISVPTSMDQEEVAQIVQRYGFLAVPVVDESHRMVGVVTVDDVIDIIREEATEDLFKMAGAGDDILYFQESFVEGVKSRFSGLVIPFLGGILASVILAIKGELFSSSAIALLFFLPLILNLSGNIANQSATLIVRGLTMDRLDTEHFFQIIGRELLIGFFLGTLMGIIVFIATFIPVFSPYIVHLGMKFNFFITLVFVLSMLFGVFSGAFLPLLYNRLQLDPATIAGNTLTAVVDFGVIAIFVLSVSTFSTLF